MSKIEWEENIHGMHTGDGLGVIVNAWKVSIADQHVLHADLLVYLDEPVENLRAALEAAIKILRQELGME